MCFLLLCLVATPSISSAQDAQPLFDGKTLNGWSTRGGKATYAVEGGVIVGRSVPHSRNTFLCTNQHYSDFDLSYEFKVDPELNSGVQIRSHEVDGHVAGYQIEIDPDEKRKRYWTAGIYDESRRGWLDDLKDNAPAREAFKPREWNRVRVLAVGSHIRTWINGVPAADLLDSLMLSGFIGLQVHGVGGRTDPLEIRWRNITLIDLGAHRWRSLFDGISLPSWAAGQAVRGGRLLLAAKDKPLSFELPGEYRDFTLRASFRSPRGAPTLDFRSVSTLWGGRDGTGGVWAKSGETLAPTVSGKPIPANDQERSVTVTTLGRRGVVHVGGQRIAATDALVGDDSGAQVKLAAGDGLDLGQLHLLQPVKIAPTLGLPPVSGARVLLGPESGWKHFSKSGGSKSGGDQAPGWSLNDGVAEVVPGQGSIETKESYDDFQMHVEFSVPADQGNSGVYIQRRYEVQILNSYNMNDDPSNCGSLYRLRRPDINVSLPPHEWQSYDITFTAPRWDEAGAKTENARITVVHNGVIIHDDVEVSRKTGAGKPEAASAGPILLQDHGNRIRYRNVWIARR